jgi:hypothetical protein
VADELLGILTGKPAAASAQGASGIDPNIDLAVRTIIGEGANQDATGRQAIAAVIANRARATNRGFGEIVNEPGQFSAWGDPKLKARMEAVKTTDPLYQSILADVTPALQGKVDPTNGADHYYAYKTISAPDWATGAGQDIGDHRFYKIGYGAQGGDDLAGILGVTSGNAAPAGATPDHEARIAELTDPNGGKAEGAKPEQTNVAVQGGKAFFRDTGEGLNDKQSATVLTLWKGGQYDPEKGLINGRPIVAIKATKTADLITGEAPEYPTQPGTFFIDPDGHLGMVPMDDKGMAISRGGKGLGRGAIDVFQSLGKMMPGHASSDNYQSAEGNRLVYDAMHHGDLVAGAGRFASQAALTAPALVVGGEVLGAAGPVGEFLAGSAGKGIGVGNKLVRGASLASSGALEGAEAGALTSGANDQGVGANMLQGAEAGAILKPGIAGSLGAGRWAGGLARDLVDPFTTGGKERITNKVISELAADGPKALDTTQYVPGSEPTLAQATANPGLAAAERAVSAVRPTQFVAKGQANAEARNMAMEALRGDQQSLDDLIAARSKIADKARDAAFKNTTQADVAPVVDKIDEILASPSGQRDTVVKALTNIRKKLVQEIDLGNGQSVLHPESDAKQLYGIRQAINDMLSPAAHNTDQNAQLAAKELGDVKSVLDKSIEAAAPGFKKYLKTFEGASRPIDEQKFLQGLKLTDVNGNVTLSRVDQALESIRKAKGKPGTSDAKSVSPQTIKALQDLKADLMRANNSSLGKGIGSNTFQNLATNNIMGRMGLPAAAGLTLHGNPIIGAAMGLGKLAYSAQNEPMLAMLENKLLDPAYGAAALNPQSLPAGMLQRLAARNALRVAATPAYIGGNRLLGSESEKPLP